MVCFCKLHIEQMYRKVINFFNLQTFLKKKPKTKTTPWKIEIKTQIKYSSWNYFRTKDITLLSLLSISAMPQ